MSTKPPTIKNLCVVRLITSSWADGRGIHFKKSLIFQKRLSEGHNILEEDSQNIGVEEIFPKIVNMSECKDGIYIVKVCSPDIDESGYLDDYDYKLMAKV